MALSVEEPPLHIMDGDETGVTVTAGITFKLSVLVEIHPCELRPLMV